VNEDEKISLENKENNIETGNLLHEDGGIGGAAITGDVSSTLGGACDSSHIQNMAPEKVLDTVRKELDERTQKISKFFRAIETQEKRALTEGKAESVKAPSFHEDPTSWMNSSIRHFDFGGEVRYSGDEEYHKLRDEWRKRGQAIHDKKIGISNSFYNTYPNRTARIGNPILHTYGTFDDGREDDWLAWYCDAKASGLLSR